MKKLSTIFLALLMTYLMAVSALAAPQVKIDNINVNSDNITLSVVLSELPADILDLSAVTVRYTFDTEKLEYVSIEPVLIKGAQSTEGNVAWYDAGSGAITAEMLEEKEGVLFNINFKKKSGAEGNAEIELFKIEFADSKLKISKDYEVVSGTVDLGKSEQKNEDKEVADAVTAKIAAIGTVTLDSKTAIEEAEAAYAALNDTQKALVTNKAVLDAARTEYDRLVSESGSDDDDDDDSSGGGSSGGSSNRGSSSKGSSGGTSSVTVTKEEPIDNKNDVADNAEVIAVTIADIDEENWAYASAVSLIQKGIISGDSSEGAAVLRPNDAITRQEAAKMALLAMGVQPESGLELVFADSEQISDWAKDYIATAVKHNAISGYAEDNTFRANNPITREEMTAMLIKAFGWGTSDDELTFADNDKITWSKPYIAKAISLGVIKGYDDNTVRPDANITRAESFALIDRCMKLNAALTN